MGKISDIWVRLGLKKEGFDKGMDDAAKKTEKTGGKMSDMLSKVKAGWVAVGAAVMAFGREMIQATNRVGDAWSHTMAEIRGGWQSALADISNYKPDFSSFRNFFKNEWAWIKKLFGNAQEAGDAAREMSEAFDAEFELSNSLKIQRAKISGELADLQVAMRNVALSPEARMAATERYRALLEPLYEAEIAVRKNMLDKAVKAWMAGSGVSASTSDVVDFFSNYGIDAEGAAAKHPELARIYETRKGDKANQPIFDAITALTQAENGLAVELKLVNRTANTIKASLDQVGEEIAIDDIDLTDIEEIPPMDWDAILGDYDAELDAFVDKWRETQAEVAELNGMLEGAIISAMSNGMQAITDMMAGIEGADARGLMSALLQPFADTAIQLGEMLVAQGVAITAFKKSLETLQGPQAIAAGMALIAIGSAMRSGIQALARGGAGASATGTYTGESAATDPQSIKTELTVYVEGRISGSDIILSGSKTMDKWRR